MVYVEGNSGCEGGSGMEHRASESDVAVVSCNYNVTAREQNGVASKTATADNALDKHVSYELTDTHTCIIDGQPLGVRDRVAYHEGNTIA
jgi:hypothetical protein